MGTCLDLLQIRSADGQDRVLSECQKESQLHLMFGIRRHDQTFVALPQSAEADLGVLHCKGLRV